METSPDTASTCGWMIKLCVFTDAESVAKALGNSIIHTMESARSSLSPTGIMLAGGRTPKRAYEMVAQSGMAAPAGINLMISDERHVPLDHPDSNYLMLKPFMDAVHCPAGQQIMVNTALPSMDAAIDFGNRLGSFFDAGGHLDICFLGLGADGHTASLFNPGHLKESEGKNAISVDRPDGRVGISASPSIIRKSKRIVFVVTGAEKKEIAAMLLHDPKSITAGQVVFRHPHVELWVDQPARPGTV